MEKKRKTTTSTAVKQKWNAANYAKLTVLIDPTIDKEFSLTCEKIGKAKRQAIMEAMNDFIKKYAAENLTGDNSTD